MGLSDPPFLSWILAWDVHALATAPLNSLHPALCYALPLTKGGHCHENFPVADLQSRLTEVFAFTSLTVEGFHLKAEIRDTIIATYCGVHKFRLQYKPLHYAL